MTRRDFILISDALRNARPFLPHANKANKPAHEAWENTARRIADALARSTPTFDRERFLKACGVTGETGGVES